MAALTDAALATALHGALQTANRAPFEEALAQWEQHAGFCLALLRAYAASTQLGQPERLLAVLCLKNAVTRRWHQRPVGAQDQVLGPAQLHRRALGGAEGAQEEGRAEERVRRAPVCCARA